MNNAHSNNHVALITGVSSGLATSMGDDLTIWLGKLIGGVVVGVLTHLFLRFLDRKIGKKQP